MKQVLVRGGSVAVEEVPAPGVDPRGVLVRVEWSCVSAGTESASVALSGLPLYRRALKQPEHVRKALDVARDQGLTRTVSRIRNQLAAGIPTGYSCAGVVLEAGPEVEGFAAGDRVACAGAGLANHAEVVAVPVNLVARVPAHLALDEASTVTLGAIALQGIRRAAPALGETVAVLGLGILGQLTCRLLAAAGCRAIGFDPDPSRAAITAPDVLRHEVSAATDGFGADAVIVTAATPSDHVVREAAALCRKKGRIVVVGDVGLGLRRADLYEKELDVLMSTSYGPGRYDDRYELEGRDYPIGYVRWTENRNMEEYLRLLATGAVTLDGLAREDYPIDAARQAYDALERERDRPLLVLLSYPAAEAAAERTVPVRSVAPHAGRIQVAIAGAGSFAQAMHLPNLLALDELFQVRAVASRTGASAKAAASRAGAAYATTELDRVLHDPEIQLVLIATRHDLHAPLALAALEAGKHVFVEKPLALTEEELGAIERFYDGRDGPLLLTGFNRRFSPAAQRLQELVAARSAPLMASYRMNAGYVAPESWVHGPEGGGRNLGEACHVYDLFTFLTGAPPADVTALAIRPGTRRYARNDNFAATVEHADGSVCSLTYTALGGTKHPKEQLDVFADGRVFTLDDYRALRIAGSRTPAWRGVGQDKGHRRELEALARCLRDGGPWPIPLHDQLAAMRVAFRVEVELT